MNEPNDAPKEAATNDSLDPNMIWIGPDAMKYLVEKAERAYFGYYHRNAEDAIDDGLRYIEEALNEFVAVSNLRVRLIFGPSHKPVRELDLTRVANEQGHFTTDEVQLWIQQGAAVIADLRDPNLSAWDGVSQSAKK